MTHLESVEYFLRMIEDAQLVVASKTQPIELLREIHQKFPNVVFGENRVQELLDKYDPELTWHFIGQLQTNKVKYIIDKVDLIQSLDRESLLKEIDARAKEINKVQKCLIQINLTLDPNRGGIRFHELEYFLRICEDYKNVKIEGLMAVMPVGKERDQSIATMMLVKHHFKKHKFKILSLGMSDDFRIAIDYGGSNMVRLGRGIFGDRK